MSSSTEMQWLKHEEVLSLASYAELVKVMKEAFLKPVHVPRRTQIPLTGVGGSGGTLLLMPAWQTGELLGVKLVNVFPDNGTKGLRSVNSQYVLFSASTGEARAMIDGCSLTNVRTAAVSAMAAQLVAEGPVSRLLLVGTGSLASYMVRAHAAAQRLKEVQVWGRRFAKAQEVAAELVAHGLPAVAVDELQQAASTADLICCATSSVQPLIKGRWLRPGVHLDLVGSFQPHMREVDDEAAAMATITVDTAVALAESGDLVEPLNRKIIRPDEVSVIEDVLRSGGVSTDKPVTMFKSVGTAIGDLAVAAWLLERSAVDDCSRPA